MAKSEKFTGENSIFAQRLKEIMKEHGVTQQHLAEKLNMTRQAVSLYLTGQALPAVDKLLTIVNYFDVSADYLIGRSDVKSADEDIQMICKYTGLSDEAVNNLIDVTFERNDLKNYKNEKSAYDLKQATLTLINFILEDRLALNQMAINFNAYYSLMSDETYDPDFINLQELHDHLEADSEYKEKNMCIVPQWEMADFKLYTFIQSFTEMIKYKTEHWRDNSSCPQ